MGVPVAIRVSGAEIAELRTIAEEMKAMLRKVPFLERVRDDWGADSFSVGLQVDSDRANLAGVTNLDVAQSSSAGLSGTRVGNLREGNRTIPIMSRMRADDRARLSELTARRENHDEEMDPERNRCRDASTAGRRTRWATAVSGRAAYSTVKSALMPSMK